MTNRTQRIIDTALMLRDIADGAETSTANETAISFDCRKIGEFKAIINITAVDGTTGDETYAFDISVSDLVGGTFTKVATLPALVGQNLTAPLVLEIPLSGPGCEQLDADSDWIRIGCTLAGTSPSITYGAFLTKV